MTWPTARDYSEALQFPRTCFVEPELQAASVLLKNKFDLPVGPTGTYAVVYKVGINGQPWAVKCFVSEVQDQHERYAAISQHLAAASLPHIVGFKYIRDGIRLSGFPRRTFPLLKMEWVSGPRLDAYVKDNLYDAAALHALAAKWVDMIRALRAAGIGHGDLQHGNVIVANGDLRLLDYDGMTVPALVGRKSLESGHRNYQHPARLQLARQLGPDVDNFSSWVILLSLVAVSIDPTLWYRAAAGDENLLFKQQDFEAPEQSEILRALEQSGNAQLCALTSAFRHFINERDLTKVPSLDGVVLSEAAPGTRAARGSWIHDHLAIGTPAVAEPPSPLAQNAGDRAVLYGRTSVAVLFLACCISPLLASGNVLLAVDVLLVLLQPAALYAIMQAIGPGAEKRRIERQRVSVSTAIQKSDKTVRDALDAEARANNDERNQITAIGTEQQAVAQRERAERDRVNAELQRNVSSLQNRRRDLTAREARELARELERLQAGYIAQRLTAFRIHDAKIDGVSAELKRRLVAHSIRTAADARRFQAGSFVLPSGAWVHVDGFGAVRGQRVVDWADGLAATVGRHAPRALDPAKDANIRRKYEVEARTLSAQEAASHTKAQQDMQAVATRYRQQQDALMQQVHSVRQKIAVWRAENQKKVHAERQEIARLRAELANLDAQLRLYLTYTFGRYVRRVAVGTT